MSVGVIVLFLTILFACGKVGALDCDNNEVKSRVLAEFATQLRDNFAEKINRNIKASIDAGDTALKVFNVKGYENLKAATNKSDLNGSAKMAQEWINGEMTALEAAISKSTLTEIRTISKDDGVKKCDCEGVVKGEGFNDVIEKYSVRDTSEGLRVELTGEGSYQASPKK
jgi:hypothetical protein